MKYKCINEYKDGNIVVMVPEDIIVLSEHQLYNLTKKTDYVFERRYLDTIKHCLETITDDTIPESDADKFRKITKEMCDTFRRKNHDYGNSFEQSLNDEGLAASRIRMGDKWNRFKSLSKGEKAQVNDESIKDTLLDMANYAIMTVMWLDKNGNV